MLDDEVRDILRELLASTGATAATIATIAPPDGDDGDGGDGDDDGGTHTAPLGGGSELRLALGAEPADGDTGAAATATAPGDTVAIAIEHAVRALRAAARRWDAELPVLSIGDTPANAAEKAADRIHAYLGALAAVQGARNACLVVDHRVLAWAHTPEALDEARWPLLERRASASAPAGTSSHGEVVDHDAYAVTFWYGAALIVYFGAPYGVDFVRHRVRLVTRELALLLPMLDPGPGSPAQRLPRP
ncbi:MAG: hypothetical protein H6708_23055 [Kofleriaceae bacterium]|nr:hypothetical protein [Kofleriaceae bacterium]